jgi:hypothetical protein
VGGVKKLVSKGALLFRGARAIYSFFLRVTGRGGGRGCFWEGVALG